MCITHIRIGHTQCPDDGSYFILFNWAASQRQSTGSFVDICDSKGESLCFRKPAAIHNGDLDVNRFRHFIVKTSVVLKFKLAIHHFKTTIVYDIDMCITCIRVGHTQCPDDGSCFILFNCDGVQFNGNGLLIDICDSKGESLCFRKSAAILSSYGNLDRLCSLIVKALAIHEFKIAFYHFKTTIVYGIGMCIIHIRIGYTQCPNDSSC